MSSAAPLVVLASHSSAWLGLERVRFRVGLRLRLGFVRFVGLVSLVGLVRVRVRVGLRLRVRTVRRVRVKV